MSNVKRNDPCPCGSGKKYKKCCGMSNVIEISPQLYNDELDELHHDLLAFSMGNYEDKFIEQTEKYFQPLLISNEETADAYLMGLTFWTILTVPFLEKGLTIFDVFYKQQQGKIKRIRTRKTLSEWANIAPSVYEVLSIDHEITHMATIVELSTHEEFQIPIMEEEGLLVESILIGSLVPFVGHHCFLFNMIEIYGNHKGMVVSLFKEYSQTEGKLKEDFPNFLAEVLSLEEMTFTWKNPLYEMVADLFAKHMVDKGIDQEKIAMGTIFWHKYSEERKPNFKNPAPYAAALEYLAHTLIIDGPKVTQKQIAEEYGTTAGSVSTNYRKFISMVEEDMSSEDIITGPESHFNNQGSFDMERNLRDIQRMLEEEEFDSAEEANAFLQKTLNSDADYKRGPISPRDTAQDMLFEAQKAQGKRRDQLIKDALSIYPNSADAYILLAENAHSESAYEELLRKAILVGEKDLGKAFFLENKGHFWLMIETRPYMRAKGMYANFLYEIGENKEALKHYNEMLRLNPNDNQGIRYTLLTLYIEERQLNQAKALIEQYSDEATAAFLFNKIIVDYFTNGVTNHTKRLIKSAKKQNPFVTDYLLGKREIPDQDFDYIDYGGEIEAIVYAQDHIHIWESAPELLKLLNK